MTPLERAQQLVSALETLEVRATVDPSLIAPPCLLFVPPNVTFDLSCAADVQWQCPILAPAQSIAETGTWQELDRILTAVSGLVSLQSADLVSYVVGGRQYPAYLLTWQEGI